MFESMGRFHDPFRALPEGNGNRYLFQQQFVQAIDQLMLMFGAVLLIISIVMKRIQVSLIRIWLLLKSDFPLYTMTDQMVIPKN